jgi:hypothetical protein
MATPVANSVALTADPLKNGLLQGSSWVFFGPRILTYSYNVNFDYDDNGQPIPGPGGNWAANPALAAAIVKALATWSAVANVGFSSIVSGNYVFQSTADISFGLTGDDLVTSIGAAALGFFPDPAYATSILDEAGYTRTQYPRPEGDVLLDNYYSGFNHLADGGFGLWTIIHEIGHALGLKHSFDDGGNARPLLDNAYDLERFTVMSYSGVASISSIGHAATPMPLDILAIQHVYGTNTAYRTGDDVYALVLDGAMRTLWDAGGRDRLDAAGLVGGVTLDLRPGALMDLGNSTVLGIAYAMTIEDATGGAGNDTLYGNGADNLLAGNGGSNTYYGGAGSDTYVVSSSTDVVIENPGEGDDDTVLASVSFDASGYGNIETITLTGGDDINATAGMGMLRLNGNAGANMLSAGAGQPDPVTMAGGAGDDVYVLYAAYHVVLELANAGTDTVSLQVSSNYTLQDHVENLVFGVQGGFLQVVLTGNALNNAITGGTGNEMLDGAAGADTLTGGGGADTYVVDSAGDVIVEALDSAYDTVRSSISHALVPFVENLVLTGDSAIDGVGNGLANLITGNGSANQLHGESGHDFLIGAGGNDTLDGGSGFDWMEGGAGDDIYVVDTALPATGLAILGRPGEYVSGGGRYLYTAADGGFSVGSMADLTGDGLVDSLTLSFGATDMSSSWNLVFSTNRLGQNLAVGHYADAQRAAFAQAGHAGLDIFGNGNGSNMLFGSFSILALQIDYSGQAPVLASFSASFEQHSESPSAPALLGAINFNGPDGIAEGVSELAGEGVDTVRTSVSYRLTNAVENLTLTGAAAIAGWGNAGSNSITGNGGANMLTGGLGDDTIDGGAGFDTAMFSGARAGYTITKGTGATTVVGADGTDLLTNIEKLLFDDGEVLLKAADSDFDGDGKSDILWRNGVNGQNTIWKSGSSAMVQSVVTVGDPAWKMVGSGDFNADGKADILWRNTSNGLNTVWLGGNSANAMGLTNLADQNWQVVGVGDFNADGKSDIVWRNGVSGQNSIWRSGSSLTQQSVVIVADQNWRIAGVGDFNGDGISDLLWRNAGSGINTIWKGGSNTSTISVATLADANWKIVGVADFNGDGRADILWRNNATGVNSIWRSGSNTDVQSVATIADPNWTVAGTGDYDGNGVADVLWRNSANGLNSVWFGGNSANAMGLTTQAVAWSMAPYKADATVMRTTQNDFNGDGTSDILWRNTATGVQAAWLGANNATAQGLVTLADQNWKVAGIGDFDGDKKSDILWRNTTTGVNTVWKSGNNANGHGVTAVADQAWKIVGVGDFNADGKADILWRSSTSGLNAIWNNGNNATSTGVATVADQNWQVVGIGDFNGDKSGDILWRNSSTGVNTIWRSGNSATTQSVATVADPNWKVAGVGDFNNDGISDILWRNAVTGVNTIWNGGNSTTTQSVTTLADMNWQVVGTGDYNGDGSADILWRNNVTGVNAIWKSGNNATTQAFTALADLNWSVIDGLESGDLLTGGAGANTLYGTVHSDLITGGPGNDTMTGGPGADLFRYLSASHGQDSITDFLPGVDKIQLVSSGFANLPVGALAAGKLVSGAAPVANQAGAQFLYNTTSGLLAFDADGTGGGAAVNLVTLVGQPALTATDLTLVAT